MTEHAGFSVNNPSLAVEPLGAEESDALKMQRFLRWMEEQGATFPSMTIRTMQGSRQVHATRPLLPGELVLHVPRKLMITPEVAMASETGRLIAAHGSRLTPHEYIAAYLLEIKRDGGFWKPYVDVLPTDFSALPLLFSEAELDALTGSHNLQYIRHRIRRNVFLYEQLPPCLRTGRFTLEEFTWARCAVNTRVYGMTIAGTPTVAMVPLADMFDHAPDRNLHWQKTADTGFVVTSLGTLPAGAALFENYGKRSNTWLLTTYGFCLEENPDNESEIAVRSLQPDHPYAEQARTLGMEDGEFRSFMVPGRYDDDAARALFSYLRLACLGDTRETLAIAVDADKVPPVSHDNEAAALKLLAAACENRLQQFATTAEHDEALLKKGGLSLNVRNAVRARHDEKIILNHFLDLARTALPLLQDASCDLDAHAAEVKPHADYFAELARCLASKAV